MMMIISNMQKCNESPSISISRQTNTGKFVHCFSLLFTPKFGSVHIEYGPTLCGRLCETVRNHLNKNQSKDFLFVKNAFGAETVPFASIWHDWIIYSRQSNRIERHIVAPRTEKNLMNGDQAMNPIQLKFILFTQIGIQWWLKSMAIFSL